MSAGSVRLNSNPPQGRQRPQCGSGAAGEPAAAQPARRARAGTGTVAAAPLQTGAPSAGDRRQCDFHGADRDFGRGRRRAVRRQAAFRCARSAGRRQSGQHSARRSASRKSPTSCSAKGVIDQPWVFMGGVIALKARGELKYGEYQFIKHASLADVVDTIIDNKVVQHAVTIAEGLTSEQIVARLLENHVALRSDQGNSARRHAAAGDLQIHARHAARSDHPAHASRAQARAG